MENIRNFAIIAHIDHGKSTLADRIMEICKAVPKDHPQQLLDSLELEREPGITIKLKAIRLVYSLSTGKAGLPFTVHSKQKNRNSEPITVNRQQVENYIFNLIDTPGHVDFSYEVSRSLASVEGVLLVVDATQGVQAQTLANFHFAMEASLVIIPVINKIDSPLAQVEETEKELIDLGFRKEEIIKISAKTGEGVDVLLAEVISRIPPPPTSEASGEVRKNAKLQALVFDSSLDPYKGVVATVRIFGGQIKVGEEIAFSATGAKAVVLQAGFLSPFASYVESLKTGEVGFIVTNVKDLSKVAVGDTLINPKDPTCPLAGYKSAKPVVFLSFFPISAGDFPKLKDSFEKLKLSDAALTFTPESSISLGQGLRVGFLGLLHAQITQERLEREYDLDILVTSPSVNFIVDGKIINKPSEFNPAAAEVKEPYAKVTIFAPQKFYGAISKLIYEKRGTSESFENIGKSLKIEAKMPLLELLVGFYDQLKTQTSGYASFDFEVVDYREAKLVKLDILVNHEPVEGLAQIIPAQKAEEFGRKLVEKLKEVIPRQNIPIPIQAAIGGKIIARETVPAFRKDVTQKLYGGDVTRKMKLLEKQKKGKKRMKRFGQVDIPQEAFLAVLKI